MISQVNDARSVRVMAVDDSALVREFMRQTLSGQPWVEEVITAPDPVFAWERLGRFKPDVITLDIEMPRMDGLTFLKKIMAESPRPVVMFSAYTAQGAKATVEALSIGAVDFITKPASNLSVSLPGLAREITDKVRAAAGARVPGATPAPASARPSGSAAGLPPRRKEVVVIGASTGGTAAIETILSDLNSDAPPVAVVQHMPPKFTEAFANRLDAKCAISVAEARDGVRLDAGQAVIAPGGLHMILQRGLPGWQVEVKDGPPVNRHKPSVDVLFRSAANTAGAEALGILLTGMGDDGARGLKSMRKSGGLTVAQDEATSVIYGMPRAAVEMEAAGMVLPLDQIARVINGRG